MWSVGAEYFLFINLGVSTPIGHSPGTWKAGITNGEVDFTAGNEYGQELEN